MKKEERSDINNHNPKEIKHISKTIKINTGGPHGRNKLLCVCQRQFVKNQHTNIVSSHVNDIHLRNIRFNVIKAKITEQVKFISKQ